MDLENQCMRLREEANMYKGKCANQTRDIDIASTYMNKMTDEHTSQKDQFKMFKDRVRQLE